MTWLYTCPAFDGVECSCDALAWVSSHSNQLGWGSKSHLQQLWFPSETPGCSGRLWRLRRNLVFSDGHITHTTLPRQWNALHKYLLYVAPGMWWCVRTIRTTRVLQSSQWLQLSCRRWPNAWRCSCLAPAKCHIVPLRYCYISDAVLSHICLALRCCHLWQYSLRLEYITCRCICFAIIVFYRSQIYCLIFTLSSTMPSVLHILCWCIIGL